MTHISRKTLLPLAAVLIALGLSTGCSSDNDDSNNDGANGPTRVEKVTNVYTIRPYKEPCQTANRNLCLIGDVDGGETERLYSGIDGLNFRWGVITVAEVEATRVENPNSDVTDWNYRLIRVITETPVAPLTEFEITIDQQDVAPSETCNYSLLNEITFGLSGGADCAPFNALLQTAEPVRSTFEFTGDEASPIALKEYSKPIEPFP